ncbi:MAG: TIGR03905 family TSCPD domain-containing protein [Parasporobacterium sp.]|nr:TIGR03905 family TSCPD domain-containing protein [Parasporobacterium sp.]
MRYTHKNKGVCSVCVSFDLEGDKVSNVEFTGGCNGNLKAIAALVDGMTVDEIEKKLKGNLCGMKGTSCADQFAIGVREAFQKEQAGC